MLADFQNSSTVAFSMKYETNPCCISYQTLNVFLHYLAKPYLNINISLM